MAKFNSSESVKIDSRLVRMCIEAANESRDAIEAWRRQRRTLERLPSQLADVLFHRLLRRRLLFPSLLEVFKHCVEEVNLKGENSVDAKWMAYLGGFHYLRTLNMSDCRKMSSSSLWPITDYIILYLCGDNILISSVNAMLVGAQCVFMHSFTIPPKLEKEDLPAIIAENDTPFFSCSLDGASTLSFYCSLKEVILLSNMTN
ncbi:uncharacterized protein LOC115999516 [Ipomoea triloba]|uniref:uncharacterized protein LOC115999516 n=1 Tax=Ipomoea triloba TaxID=35885 RepID=UPI00125E482D|nr:uncharacterized protein LOC115999516 [Ipomoea triloba]